MTSKIVVNNIEADTGISTVTFNSNISGNFVGNVNTTGVSTFSNIRVTGGTISGVTTAGITTVYTNSFNGGQLGGSRNMIINGSMVVNQRGFTGAAGTTTDGGFPVDRFQLGLSHDGAVSAGQTSMNSTVGGNAYADGFQNAHILRVTTADASLAAGQYQNISQKIEGYNVQGIKKGTANAQPVTLSFWVRSSTTGTYIAELYDNDNTRQVSQAYTINAANTWEKKALTFPADTTGAFDNDNALSLYVFWWLAAGSTYSGGTLNTSWAANTNANRAVGQTNLLATAGNDFFLTGVQLEVGDRATEFERRSFGDELRLCQRYYETSYDIGTAPGSITGSLQGAAYFNHNGASGTFIVGGFTTFAVRKRGTPSVTLYSPSTGTSGKVQTNRSGNTDGTGAAATIYTSGFSGGFTEGSGTTCNLITYNWVASAEL
jgi:hypothetical protein